MLWVYKLKISLLNSYLFSCCYRELEDSQQLASKLFNSHLYMYSALSHGNSGPLGLLIYDGNLLSLTLYISCEDRCEAKISKVFACIFLLQVLKMTDLINFQDHSFILCLNLILLAKIWKYLCSIMHCNHIPFLFRLAYFRLI